tara:strand:+ start:54 stop:623 length:570 start_codon:yes stop_codon:yes gene_type:complete
MTTKQTILRVDSSARKQGSTTRTLTDLLVSALSDEQTATITRDLADGIGMYTEKWVEGTFTPIEDRSPQHKFALSESDILVGEVQQADILVIGAPMYNFSIGASLKAWVDMIARAGVTFRYTEKGPVGLLGNIKTYIVASSGGTPVGSDADFGTKYLKFFLAFVGLTDVTILSSKGEITTIAQKHSKAA